MTARLFDRCLQRLGALGLLALLALGPFLHAHLGQARLSGFHLDGVQLHDHSVHADHPVLSAEDESETPAVGVAGSLPRVSEKTVSATDLVCWLTALVWMVLPWPWARPAAPSVRASQARRTYRRGAPPPALAPPAH